MATRAQQGEDIRHRAGNLPLDEVTVSELRRNLKDYVGSMERTVVTRDNRPASVLMHVKDFVHREALLRWALDDPDSWAQAMAAHRRVQREGARGVELEELEGALRPAASSAR